MQKEGQVTATRQRCRACPWDAAAERGRVDGGRGGREPWSFSRPSPPLSTSSSSLRSKSRRSATHKASPCWLPLYPSGRVQPLHTPLDSMALPCWDAFCSTSLSAVFGSESEQRTELGWDGCSPRPRPSHVYTGGETMGSRPNALSIISSDRLCSAVVS